MRPVVSMLIISFNKSTTPLFQKKKKTTRILQDQSFFFFCSFPLRSGYPPTISETERAIIDPLVSKGPENIARGTTDPEIDYMTWIKFINNMAPLALNAYLATRWHHLH